MRILTEKAAAQSRIVFLHPNGKVAQTGRLMEITHRGGDAVEWRIRLDNGKTITKFFAFTGEHPPIWEEDFDAFVVREKDRRKNKETARSWKSGSTAQPSAGGDPETDNNFTREHEPWALRKTATKTSGVTPHDDFDNEGDDTMASFGSNLERLLQSKKQLAALYQDTSPGPDSDQGDASTLDDFSYLGHSLHHSLRPDEDGADYALHPELTEGDDIGTEENLMWPSLIEDPDLGRGQLSSGSEEDSNFLDDEGDLDLEGQPMTETLMSDPFTDFLTSSMAAQDDPFMAEGFENDGFIPHGDGPQRGSNFALQGPVGMGGGESVMTVSSLDEELAAIDGAGLAMRRHERNMGYHLGRLAEHLSGASSDKNLGHKLEHHLGFALAHAKALHHAALTAGRPLSEHEHRIIKRTADALDAHTNALSDHLAGRAPSVPSKPHVSDLPPAPYEAPSKQYDTVPTRKNPEGKLPGFKEHMQQTTVGPAAPHKLPRLKPILQHRNTTDPLSRLINHTKDHANAMRQTIHATGVSNYDHHGTPANEHEMRPVDTKGVHPIRPLKNIRHTTPKVVRIHKF